MNKKWKSPTTDGKTKYIGTYSTAFEAALAWDAEVIKLRGLDFPTNF